MSFTSSKNRSFLLPYSFLQRLESIISKFLSRTESNFLEIQSWKDARSRFHRLSALNVSQAQLLFREVTGNDVTMT